VKPNRTGIPKGLRRFWWFSVLLGGSLVLEQVWEQTLLTWKQGPQMVGFTLMHAFAPLALAGILGYYAIYVWLLLVAVFFIRCRSLPVSAHLPMIIVALLIIALALIPYSFWARLGGVVV